MPSVVRFSASVKVVFVPALSEMSDEEKIGSFGSDRDPDLIQADIVKTVKAMRRGCSEDDDEICFRGLEHLQSTLHLEQRKINKDMVTEAVLGEQNRQMLEGAIDSDKIALQSIRGSRWARELALKNSASDETYVKAMLLVSRKEKHCAGAEDTLSVIERALAILGNGVEQHAVAIAPYKRGRTSAPSVHASTDKAPAVSYLRDAIISVNGAAPRR